MTPEKMRWRLSTGSNVHQVEYDETGPRTVCGISIRLDADEHRPGYTVTCNHCDWVAWRRLYASGLSLFEIARIAKKTPAQVNHGIMLANVSQRRTR